jgi:hypothetical protein
VKKLPNTEHSLVLRTDFSDDAAWNALCAAMQEPSDGGFRAFVDCISDPAYAGLTVDQLVALPPEGTGRSFVFIADQVTFTDPKWPVFVVDLHAEPGRTFRVIPREMWGVENNLSIANMDFYEFADKAEPDGVFRGFPCG